MKVVINGRVLLSPLNGIPRFAYEVIAELDKLFQKGEATLIMPENDCFNGNYKNIEVVQSGVSPRGWDVGVAEKFAKSNGAVLLSLSSVKCFYKKSVICIHDIRPLTWGNGDKSLKSLKNYLRLKFAFGTIARNAGVILTVSEFAKREIIDYFKLKPARQVVVSGNGWEHLTRISVNETLDKKLKGESYYFSISSVAPHKNFIWVLRAAKYNKDKKFYIAGRVDRALWSDDVLNDLPENVEYLGFISDDDMKTYMQNAEALLFPSLYEGFGIPPMEALALGVPAVVSDIPVLREIFGGSAHYINPLDPNVDLGGILKQPVAPAASVLEKYTWKNSAELVYKLVNAAAEDAKK